MQAMQGASLVGHDVIVPGNKLRHRRDTAIGQGGFELADAGRRGQGRDPRRRAARCVDTLNLGAQGAGMPQLRLARRHGAATSGLTFRVTATSGGAAIDRDRADARPRRRGQHQRRQLLTLELETVGRVALRHGQGLQLTSRSTPRDARRGSGARHELPARSLRSRTPRARTSR